MLRSYLNWETFAIFELPQQFLGSLVAVRFLLLDMTKTAKYLKISTVQKKIYEKSSILFTTDEWMQAWFRWPL